MGELGEAWEAEVEATGERKRARQEERGGRGEGGRGERVTYQRRTMTVCRTTMVRQRRITKKP